MFLRCLPAIEFVVLVFGLILLFPSYVLLFIVDSFYWDDALWVRVLDPTTWKLLFPALEGNSWDWSSKALDLKASLVRLPSAFFECFRWLISLTKSSELFIWIEDTFLWRLCYEFSVFIHLLF